MRSWRLEHSETLFQHKIFKLLRHHLRAEPEAPGLESTKQALVLEAPDWVNVIPRLADGQVVLVRQWRYGIGAATLEIPGGMIDPGETPVVAAGRELFEETGYRAGTLQELGVVEPNPAFLSNRCTTFLATGLESFGPPQGDGDEEIEIVTLPLREIPQRIADGEIRHAIVIAAFHWLLLRSPVVATILATTLFVTGCRQPVVVEKPQALETVAVSPQLDAGADMSGDPQAKAARVEALGGVLPGDFPRQFPLPPGGSIVDLGVDLGNDESTSFVVLRYPTPANDVLRKVSGMAQSRGWTRDGERYLLGGREVRVRAAARGMATELRLDYQP